MLGVVFAQGLQFFCGGHFGSGGSPPHQCYPLLGVHDLALLLFPLYTNQNSFLPLLRTQLNLLNFTKTPAFCGFILDNSPTNRGIQGIGLAGRHSHLYTPSIFPVDGKDTRKEFT
ncbi:hypothetical protein IQ274_04845 [Nostoc sp. LEGE 12447]|uniref:hypothetical protein n=1 Tax=Nostoc sp. LEGE 12447 TaxID=1828640 RepID=UPI001883A406|nr:hypothetical protein [Nostoc sp. LEGE 12447]MBE8997559.1 hypothetical protein [Nostoc sp. LEGE 12447]